MRHHLCVAHYVWVKRTWFTAHVHGSAHHHRRLRLTELSHPFNRIIDLPLLCCYPVIIRPLLRIDLIFGATVLVFLGVTALTRVDLVLPSAFLRQQLVLPGATSVVLTSLDENVSECF